MRTLCGQGLISRRTMDRLTDKKVDGLPVPATANRRWPDGETAGFGIVITQYGKRSFYLRYRNKGGSDRQFTIGSRPEWSTSAARKEALRLKHEIDNGVDPV